MTEHLTGISAAPPAPWSYVAVVCGLLAGAIIVAGMFLADWRWRR